MTDIVERLRTFDAWEKVIARHKLVQDAADEIERLRQEDDLMQGVSDGFSRALVSAEAEIERLRAALREVGKPDRGYEAWRIRVAREALDE